MDRALRITAVLVALALSSPSVAAACWCRELTRANACTEAALFLTGVVESVEVGESSRTIRIRVLAQLRGEVPSTLVLRTPGGSREISSCDPARVPVRGDIVRLALRERDSLTLCDLVEVLESEADARVDPCASRQR